MVTSNISAVKFTVSERVGCGWIASALSSGSHMEPLAVD